ncbi:hypothetical protein MHU86_19054 [Fragilaria crotonensis]|nr:hypothetical protein MHU86_19054 [Fragilaria crotonensis]
MPVPAPTSLDDTFSLADDASLLSHFTQRTDDASLMSHFTQRALPDPPFYMHDQCKLQKDKNKGDAVGSEICAVGKNACLEKMRQKMELLTQVALGASDSTKSNDVRKLKRRARV